MGRVGTRRDESGLKLSLRLSFPTHSPTSPHALSKFSLKLSLSWSQHIATWCPVPLYPSTCYTAYSWGPPILRPLTWCHPAGPAPPPNSSFLFPSSLQDIRTLSQSSLSGPLSSSLSHALSQDLIMFPLGAQPLYTTPPAPAQALLTLSNQALPQVLKFKSSNQVSNQAPPQVLSPHPPSRKPDYFRCFYILN